ncbi:MAG: T9SS type B sorting domain-containing protein, partial [Winogradskyella sp.]|nr:T9SS type B sorting domain-containing protein [Winogradskyella sp.]
NDTWIILNAERYPNAVIRVFSRSGNEVFSSRGYNNDWSGTSNSGGDTLPTGSYYYQIDQNGDGSVILTGWIYLTL